MLDKLASLQAIATGGDLRRRMRLVILAVVVAAPAAASWQGLTKAGHDLFGLGGWAFLVPLVFDAAALYAASMALEDVLRGDSAVANRVLIWAYALGSAGMNAYHAHHMGNDISASVFYAVASISAAILFDRTLKRARRDELARGNHLEQPLPTFRALRWMFAPATTLFAYRWAVLEGLQTPADALAYRWAVKHHGKEIKNRGLAPAVVIAYARAKAANPVLSFSDWMTPADSIASTFSPRAVFSADDLAELPQTPAADEPMNVDQDQDQGDEQKALEADPQYLEHASHGRKPHADCVYCPTPSDELEGLSKAQVVLAGIRAMGGNPDIEDAKRHVPAAVQWAAERGVAVDRSYAYDAIRRHLAKVTAVNSNVVELPARVQEG